MVSSGLITWSTNCGNLGVAMNPYHDCVTTQGIKLQYTATSSRTFIQALTHTHTQQANTQCVTSVLRYIE